LRGHLRILFFYDVAEAIRLDILKSLLGSSGEETGTSLTQPIPHYLRFERPPIVEQSDPFRLETGETIARRIKYYDYGVISIELELPFESGWDSLVRESIRWIGSPELESQADELLRIVLKRSASAQVKPYKSWLKEDYYIIHLEQTIEAGVQELTAETLLRSHSREIVQLVRGESVSLSETESQEVLQSRISYSPNDLLVVGWTGALVYNSPEGAAASIQLLEYANTQLLEFRHYDGLLTRVLEDVYRGMEKNAGLAAAWRLSREAASLNTILLDVMELTEKVDNAIKFLSDMFYARLYGLAAAKVGVPDYRRLVDQKLRTARELYRFMVEQFNQTRSFVLEMVVIIILVIDLVALFRGK
jgi:hypothetical protein